MSKILTEVTEIVTALGTLAPDLPTALHAMPAELKNVPDTIWKELKGRHAGGDHTVSFDTAFANGVALLNASQGLRGRRPALVEWKGPHRLPGDDVIPADLRLDHVYLVSCKYLSKVLLNPGPARLFDRLLVGEGRGPHWFEATAPVQFQQFYEAARDFSGIAKLPRSVADLTSDQQQEVRTVLSARLLPSDLQAAWAALCHEVSRSSAGRWTAGLTSKHAKLRLLCRLLRITNATYFVLGTDNAAHLRLRVASKWDWNQSFELRTFVFSARVAGQPEVAWQATIGERTSGKLIEVLGHVEIRWSHGRFVGSPEAKVYLDTPLSDVPGYYALV